MRVITGSCRGKKLKTLEGTDTRPTSDMVKEAVFSIIQFELPEANVLDLFAGSGQLGIEALSRGAKHCVFVDKNPEAVKIVRENVSDCGFVKQSRILGMDSPEYLKTAKSGLDIAFVDPPYRMGLIEKVLPLLEGKLNEGAFVICEHERELTLPDEFGRLTLHKRYRYGKIALTVYKIPMKDEEE
ncbi:MAG: 16S rRNA (guanine(966)-N(2))-methyltransferase RsmD [Ruminococcus sp.]|nr:16S rRNA (guanine(966)-N(2))-methyltransferase RsmD [Ruminococcus sp.]